MADLGAPWDRDSFSAADQLVVDDLEQEAALPNKLAHADDITGDLAGLVLGRFNGRNAPSDRTAFVFRGHALGDPGAGVAGLSKVQGWIGPCRTGLLMPGPFHSEICLAQYEASLMNLLLRADAPGSSMRGTIQPT